jgi:Tfp pilus assembly protein PilP
MRALLAFLTIFALPSAAFAQGKPPARPAAPPAQTARPAAPAPAAPSTAAPAAQPPAPEPAPPPPPAAGPNDNYTYQPDGRRDPFLSLLGTGTETHGKKGDGAAAFTLAEISVRGIIESKGRLLAMVQAPDDKTYVIHPGDKFADGVVKSVTPQGLVVMQDINDPLSIQKQREVRKLLRSLEDAKE